MGAGGDRVGFAVRGGQRRWGRKPGILGAPKGPLGGAWGPRLADFRGSGRAPSQAAGRPVRTGWARRAVRVASGSVPPGLRRWGARWAVTCRRPWRHLGQGSRRRGRFPPWPRRACGDGASRATRICAKTPGATAVGEEAEVAHPHEALGQHMEQEAPDQFLPVSPAGACPRTRAVARSVGIRCTRMPCQNAVNQAARQAGIMKRVGTHTLRHTPFVSPGAGEDGVEPIASSLINPPTLGSQTPCPD